MSAPKVVFVAALILLVLGLLPMQAPLMRPFRIVRRFPFVASGLLAVLLASFIVWRLSERRWRR